MHDSRFSYSVLRLRLLRNAPSQNRMCTLFPNSAQLDRCGRRQDNIKIYRTDFTNWSPTFGFEFMIFGFDKGRLHVPSPSSWSLDYLDQTRWPKKLYAVRGLRVALTFGASMPCWHGSSLKFSIRYPSHPSMFAILLQSPDDFKNRVPKCLDGLNKYWKES